MHELELSAGTVEEFMAMLRNILHKSGMTAGKVAKLAKIPRSTAYRFADRTNITLPARVEQVERFVRACRLRDDQITRVLRTWHELNGTLEEAAVEPSTDTAEADRHQLQLVHPDEPSPAPRSGRYNATQETLFFDDLDSPSRRWSAALDNAIDQLEVVTRINHDPQPKRLKKSIPSTPQNVIVYQNNAPRQPRLIADRRAPLRSWAFRRQILVLLFMVQWPMIMRGIFTAQQETVLLHAFTFGMALISLALLPQLGRKAVAPCTTRLAIATAIGSAAGALAWWATGKPVLALMSGFIVFMAVPMWLAVMNTMWKNLFTTSRGIFAVLLATWFGVLTGVFLAAENGYIAAVLASILTGSGVLMEAAARIFPHTECPHCESIDTSKQVMSRTISRA
ncbi:hypothetical protein [Nocardia vulneris]|uniref:hypothetical protein n=1 Tax=Nocardia vulneris TaxID=1141657 RepID=UPI00147207B9|nr:hypothetical protein [Nocardia vulneris]